MPEGTRRKVVYPDDLVRYAKVWDKKLLPAFKKITRVGFVCHIALSVCFKMVPDYFPDVRKACASSLRSKTWGAILRCENA